MNILEAIKDRPDDEYIFIGSRSSFFAVEKAGLVRTREYLINLDGQLYAMNQRAIELTKRSLEEAEHAIERTRSDIEMIGFPRGAVCIGKCRECQTICWKYNHRDVAKAINRKLKSVKQDFRSRQARQERREKLHKYLDGVNAGGNEYRSVVRDNFTELNILIEDENRLKEKIAFLEKYLSEIVPIADRQVKYHCRRLQRDGYIVVVEGIEEGRFSFIEDAHKFDDLKKGLI